MTDIKQRLKKWLGITALEVENDRLCEELSVQRNHIAKNLAEMDRQTVIDADIGLRGPCTIIVSGVYRGKGFVKFYEMSVDEFKDYVERFRWEEREHLIRNVDAPHCLGFAFDLKVKR